MIDTSKTRSTFFKSLIETFMRVSIVMKHNYMKIEEKITNYPLGKTK